MKLILLISIQITPAGCRAALRQVGAFVRNRPSGCQFSCLTGVGGNGRKKLVSIINQPLIFSVPTFEAFKN